MEPSPLSVGREFVRQYYTLLNKSPLHLHRFYSQRSSFTHGGLELGDKVSESVMGQQEIHQKIVQLNFRDCHAKIRQVDAHATLDSGVVVQVSGELSNNGQPMRRFMQTFVLAPQSPKKYYLHNDIFRYQDEVFSDEEPEGIDSGTTSILDESNESGCPVATLEDQESTESPSSSSISSSRVVIIKDQEETQDEEESVETLVEESSLTNGTSKESLKEIPETIDGDDLSIPVEENPVSLAPISYAKLVKNGQANMSSSPTTSKLSSPKLISSKEGGVKDSPRSYRGGHRGGLSNRSETKERYRPEGGDGDHRYNGGRSERSNGGGPSIYNDAQQVFVGNLPHSVASSELQSLFSQYGKVAEIRINSKGNNGNKMPHSGISVPNFGFVVFEDEGSVKVCLGKRPIFLNDTHRLNVEEKKNNKSREGPPPNRMLPLFDKGSQETLRSGEGRGRGLGNSRGGARGGGGGYSRGGLGSQGGGSGGGGGQHRSRFPRKS